MVTSSYINYVTMVMVLYILVPMTMIINLVTRYSDIYCVPLFEISFATSNNNCLSLCMSEEWCHLCSDVMTNSSLHYVMSFYLVLLIYQDQASPKWSTSQERIGVDILTR